MIRTLPRISAQERLVYGLVVVWILTMISVPIVRWTLGDAALPTAVSLGVLMQVIAVCVVLISAWGIRRALTTIGVIVALAWLTEFIGHTTGFPFGSYDYTPRLQPQLGGVPLLIPLAWLMMLPPAWAIANIINLTPKTRQPVGTPFMASAVHLTKHSGRDKSRPYGSLWVRLRFIVVTALAFTAWDLFLDPQMVAWDLWRWEVPGAYFGIPLVNFAGWLLASALITFAASLIAPIRDLPARPLVIIYVITWLLETGGLAIFWGLPGPALVGFVAMGGMLLWAWRRSRGR